MAIPKYGFVNGRMYVEGEGVRWEAPLDKSKGEATVAVGGKTYRFEGGGGGGRSPTPSQPTAQEVAKAAADKRAAEQKKYFELQQKLKAEALKAEAQRIAAEKLAATRTQEALRDKTQDSRRQLEIDKARARARERQENEQRRIDQDISRIRASSGGGGVMVTKPGEGSETFRTVTYTGDIVVPGTGGLTANEYKRKLDKEAREKYGTGSGFRSEEEVSIPKVENQ